MEVGPAGIVNAGAAALAARRILGMAMKEPPKPAEALTLDDFAAICASLDAGLPRDDVLAEAGLSADAWEAAQQQWLARLAAEAQQGRLQRSRRYLARLGAERAERVRAAAKARSVPRKLEGPFPVAPKARLSPLGVGAERALEAPPDVPAALPMAPPAQPPIGPPARPPSAPPPVTSLNKTVIGARSPIRSTLPFKPGAASPPIAAPDRTPDKPNTAAPSQLGATVPLPEPARPRDPLPFARPAAPPPAADLTPEAKKRVEAITLAQYAQISADLRFDPARMESIRSHYGLDAAAWTALHVLWRDRFQRNPALRTRCEALVQQRLAVLGPPARTRSRRSGTEPTGPIQPPKAPVLPFQPSRAKPATPEPPPKLDPPDPLNTTTAPTLDVPKGPALPFRPQSAPPPRPPLPSSPAQAPAGAAPAAKPPGLAISLSEYASLCAELTLFPASAKAIFRRHGLDTQEKRASVDAALEGAPPPRPGGARQMEIPLPELVRPLGRPRRAPGLSLTVRSNEKEQARAPAPRRRGQRPGARWRVITGPEGGRSGSRSRSPSR